MTHAIRIENVSKQYRLGEVGTGTLAHDLNRLWYRMRGKEDPYTKIGAENDRTKQADSEYVWALRDVSFEVEEGQVLGIIGRNGAGKSTLLKILSRVTAPTSGRIKARGRIASLLEVGTGFHPELTGRENIFLNGAILGMNRSEIKRQLDAIVDFSGCARYLDTPVKRYSSGMMVRLGFAVAAHLECEILIVDEVLAVGDLEFQKACIGRMREVSTQEGRTVLFVSHNMSSVATLCDQGALIRKGTVTRVGDVRAIISEYIAMHGLSNSGRTSFDNNSAPGDQCARILNISVLYDGIASADIPLDRPFEISIGYCVLEPHSDITVSIHVNDRLGGCVFATANMASAMTNPQDAPERHAVGNFQATCFIPENFLNSDHYYISAFLVKDGKNIIAIAENALAVRMHDTGDMRKEYGGQWIGAIRPRFTWRTRSCPNSVSGLPA